MVLWVHGRTCVHFGYVKGVGDFEMTYKLDIMDRQYKVGKLKAEIAKLQKEIFDLEGEALNRCEHSFTAPIKGYEHEGGSCMLCGLNQIYIESNKRRGV